MELKTKLLKWSAGIPVAMLNSKTAKKLGIHPNDRIIIKTCCKKPKQTSTIIDVIKKVVNENEIAVSSELKSILELKIGQKVDINLADAPDSLKFIKKKLKGKRLSNKEIDEIIQDVVDNALSDSEVALFVSAMYQKEMNFTETIYLIKAILKTGNKFDIKGKYVADKHSIGGIPGNRTTPIVVSICAAGGLIMPKSSSRAITSAAGTADVIETIAQVEFSLKNLKKIIQKTGACMVWGGSLNMVPADSKIIAIEKQLNIDPVAQLLASVMAKKIAAGAEHILIDIPYGKTAKISKKTAKSLRKKFLRLGKYFNLNLECVLTDGSQPIGRGIGPLLEINDVLSILDPLKRGPSDLEEKSLFLAGKLFEMTKKAKPGKGIEKARKILKSGKALKKFNQIIKAQKGNLNSLKKIKLGEFNKNILVNKNLKIKSIDNKKINSLARTAGCPLDKSSGVYLHAKVGDKLKKGDKIITIYSQSKTRLNQAIKFYNEEKPIK